MNRKIVATTKQEWHYQFNQMPYEPEDMYVYSQPAIYGGNVVSINFYCKDYNGKNVWLSVATDTGTRNLMKVFYGLLREIATGRRFMDFQKYGRDIAKRRHGGYWNITYR